MSEPLSVLLERPADVLAQEPHAAAGGLFVPAPDPLPAPLAVLTVRIVTGAGVAAAESRAVQVSPAGVALAFTDPAAARTALAPLFAAARRGGPGEAEPRAAWGEANLGPTRRQRRLPSEQDGTLFERVRAMSKADRRQLALRGDRAARLVLMKDADKSLHLFVIKNPAITLDEVIYIAGYRQTNPDVLRRIADNRDWSQNPRVVSALVGNPKTPSTTAIRLLDRVPRSELSRIARSTSVPPVVVAAARRKIVGC